MSACLLCGSPRHARLFRASDRLYHTTTRQFDVVRCGQCGMVRLDPQPDPQELRRYYPDNYWFAPDESSPGRMEEAYRRLVLRDHVNFVERALRDSPASGPLLDVGCGGGLFLGMMRERGFRVLGLDFSREAAAIAWHRHRAPAVCAMLEHAPFRAGSVAGLTMFHVLEHLYDPRAYLSAAHSLLAPDGRLVVQVPNAACWQFRLLGRSWNGVDVPRHLFDFRSRDIEMLVTACGFEVVRRKHFSLRDNPAGLASSMAPSLDPMARRVRRMRESPAARLGKDLLYLALVGASLPFTALEAAFGAGSTVMIEARRR
jgi:SAM-dependent methyltransferase